MHDLERQADEILSILLKNDLITIFDASHGWYDEPHFYTYHAKINHLSEYFKKSHQHLRYQVTVGGSSYKSRELALIRCLGEFMERFSLCYYENDKVTSSSFKDIKQDALNPL